MKSIYTDGAMKSSPEKRANSINPATAEKHELLKKLASGEVHSTQIGKKLVALDQKHRTKKLVLFTSILSVIFVLISPFMPSVSAGSPSSDSSRS